MKKIILGSMVIAIAMVSCKKDKDCDLTAANLAGSYKTTAVSYKADAATAAVDAFATYDACEKDDIAVFNANNTITYTDAGVTCTPPDNSTGIWALSGSSLTTDGGVATVTSFSCSGMTLTFAGLTAGELTTVTLVKQ